MKKTILVIISFICLIAGCNTTDPISEPERPPGYQEDIPWPSLADTPWPMHHGDPQGTGRSKNLGPTTGLAAYTIASGESQTGMTIGLDFTIYYTADGKVIASDYNGDKKWELKIAGELDTTPLLSSDSTLYIAGGAMRNILALRLDGSIRWEYTSQYDIWNSTLGIDKNSNLYFIDNNRNLTALSQDGVLLWQINDSRFLGNSSTVLAFSPDGDIIYLQGINVYLLAVNIKTQEVIWTFGENTMRIGPMVDSQGNIYIFPEKDNYFYSLLPTGEVRWKFLHDEGNYTIDNIEPAIDIEGNIYFGFKNLYSLDYSGNLRWSVDLEDYLIFASIITDNTGNVYVSTSKDFGDNKAIGFNSSGDKLWERKLEFERLPGASMAISDDGSLFIPNFRCNNIEVIK